MRRLCRPAGHPGDTQPQANGSKPSARLVSGLSPVTGSGWTDRSVRLPALLCLVSCLAFCLLSVGLVPPPPALAATEGQASLSLDQVTTVVTAKSGFQADVTVTNTGGSDLTAGKAQVLTSTRSISSTDSLQDWEDADSNLSTPVLLAQAEVTALPQGEKATVSLHADPDTIAAMIHSWGAKPLRVVYSARTAPQGTQGGTSVSATLHSTLTRSRDGFTAVATPAITIATVLPVTSSAWSTSDAAVKKLVSNPTDSPTVAQLSAAGQAAVSAEIDLAAQHPHLGVIADPALLQKSVLTGLTGPAGTPSTSAAGTGRQSSTTSSLPQSSLVGLTTPYDFDITARASLPQDLWAATGIEDSAWDSTTAHQLAIGGATPTGLGSNSSSNPNGAGNPSNPTGASPSSDDLGSGLTSADATGTGTDGRTKATASGLDTTGSPTIALEGHYSWNQDSLALARRQGYSVVLADSARQLESQSNVVTGRLQSSGVTVLVAEHSLSSLIQGHASAKAAAAERSQAGRTARFIAQTAIFQMQQPYVARSLLVDLGAKPALSQADAILSALDSADWVAQGSLTDLIKPVQAPGSATGQTGQTDTADATGSASSEAPFSLGTNQLDADQEDQQKALLTGLAQTAGTINRLKTSVLTKESVEKDTVSDENDNVQDLARQNAKKDKADKVSALTWLAELTAAHTQLGLLSFQGARTQAARPAGAAAQTDSRLADSLTQAVSVTPPSTLNVLSTTAQAPVTVKNSLPFAIEIGLNATTDSNAIIIGKTRTVTVAAGSEAQTTFSVQAIGASSATADFIPLDRGGQQFGQSATTTVYSQLSLGDMSGNILIIIAALLGLVGIYRQARRHRPTAAQTDATTAAQAPKGRKTTSVLSQ